MNVLIIADDESVIKNLPESKVDLLISCGDLPDPIILQAAKGCSCQHILAVKGNHDSSGEFPAPIVNLHMKTFAFEGISFGGFCGSWKYKPRGNYLFEQPEVESMLAAFPKVDVFVAHNSPRQTHDREDEVHIGFVAFTSYIQRHSPRILFHGHQHVQAETRLGSTLVVGTYGYRFHVIPE